jgi:hypothetical protein
MATLPFANDSCMPLAMPGWPRFNMALWVLPSVRLTHKFLSEALPPLREQLLASWFTKHLSYIHERQPPLGVVPTTKPTMCQRARFCVCWKFTLVAFVLEFLKVFRIQVKAKSKTRSICDDGMLVLRLVTANPSDCLARWYFVAHVNYTTLDAVVMPLVLDTDELRTRYASSFGAVALMPRDQSLLGVKTWWQCFDEVDHEYAWNVGVFTLSTREVITPFQFAPGRLLVVGVDEETRPFWPGASHYDFGPTKKTQSKGAKPKQNTHSSSHAPVLSPLLAILDQESTESEDHGEASSSTPPLASADDMMRPGDDNCWNCSSATGSESGDSGGSADTTNHWGVPSARRATVASAPPIAAPATHFATAPFDGGAGGSADPIGSTLELTAPRALPRGEGWKRYKFNDIPHGEIIFNKLRGKMDAHCYIASHNILGAKCKMDKLCTRYHGNRKDRSGQGRSAVQEYAWLAAGVDCFDKASHDLLKTSVGSAACYCDRSTIRQDLIVSAQDDPALADLLDAERSPNPSEDEEPVIVP